MDSSKLHQAPNYLQRIHHAQNTMSHFLTRVAPLPTLLVREASGTMSSEGPHPKEREPLHWCSQDFPHQMVRSGGKRQFWPSQRKLGRHLGGRRSYLFKVVDPGMCSQILHLPGPPSLGLQHRGRRVRPQRQWY